MRLQIEDYYKIETFFKRKVFRCCHKKASYEAGAYLKEYDDLATSIRDNMLSFYSSGHAFVLFDTPLTAAKVSKVFK